MLSYCLKFRKNTERQNPRVVRTKRRKPMLLSKCLVCGRKKSRFIKEKKAHVPLLEDTFSRHKMNEKKQVFISKRPRTEKV